jgi:hypothetical protein
MQQETADELVASSVIRQRFQAGVGQLFEKIEYNIHVG